MIISPLEDLVFLLAIILREIARTVNTDAAVRFICLCNGDSLFITEDPQSSDSLPIEDSQWAQDVSPNRFYSFTN